MIHRHSPPQWSVPAPVAGRSEFADECEVCRGDWEQKGCSYCGANLTSRERAIRLLQRDLKAVAE